MKFPTDSAFQAATAVMKTLNDRSFRALLAGGCVRDMLLSRTPKDYDVATNATPDEVRELFPKARLVGAKFGVVLVRRKSHDIEVATFRTDGVYTDGRHPDEVTFGSEEDDARRRDFTINGLFLDPTTGEIIDYVGGRDDIEASVLRTIGNANERFAEDYLRLLRAPRFAARLSFTIEESTRDAITKLAANLSHISPERIWIELEELITLPSRQRGFRWLVELGLHQHLSPNLSLIEKQCEHIAVVLGECTGDTIDPALAMAALLGGLSRPAARMVCRSLRLSNRVTDDTLWLLTSLAPARESTTLELADFKLLMAHRAWPMLTELLRAELIAEDADLSPYQELSKRASTIPESAVAPPPLLPGAMLIEMGVTPGPKFGDVLNAVYRAQLNKEIETPTEAQALARSLLHQAK